MYAGDYWGQEADVPEMADFETTSEIPQRSTAVRLRSKVNTLAPLKEFVHLKHLRVSTVDQTALDTLPAMPGLETLILGLRPSVTTLEPLARLVNLQALRLNCSARELSLVPLRSLRLLQALALCTSISTAINGGTIHVQSFGPLGELTVLTYLDLFCVKPRNDGLLPLLQLKGLRTLELCDEYSLGDLAMLAAALPDTEGFFQEPAEPSEEHPMHPGCAKCGGRAIAILHGHVRNRILCPVCQKPRLDRHVAEYNRCKERFREQFSI